MQLAGRYRGRLLCGTCFRISARGHLDLQIRSGERQFAASKFQKHVGKNWKRVTAFDNTAYGLQRKQNYIPLYGY